MNLIYKTIREHNFIIMLVEFLAKQKRFSYIKIKKKTASNLQYFDRLMSAPTFQIALVCPDLL